MPALLTSNMVTSNCLHDLITFVQYVYCTHKISNLSLECCVLNIAQHVINSSNACGYPSCLLSLHVNTFYGMFVVR